MSKISTTLSTIGHRRWIKTLWSQFNMLRFHFHFHVCELKEKEREKHIILTWRNAVFVWKKQLAIELQPYVWITRWLWRPAVTTGERLRPRRSNVADFSQRFEKKRPTRAAGLSWSHVRAGKRRRRLMQCDADCARIEPQRWCWSCHWTSREELIGDVTDSAEIQLATIRIVENIVFGSCRGTYNFSARWKENQSETWTYEIRCTESAERTKIHKHDDRRVRHGGAVEKSWVEVRDSGWGRVACEGRFWWMHWWDAREDKIEISVFFFKY